MKENRINLLRVLQHLLPGETVEFSMRGDEAMNIGMRYLSPFGGGMVHRLFVLDALHLATMEDEDVSELFKKEFGEFRSMYSELERERL